MKTITLTLTAVAALCVAAPAAAQSGYSRTAPSAELRVQIDAGVRSGALSGREATSLRESLRQLMMLERQFAANGISGPENAVLMQRSNALRGQIRMAERGTNGRYGRDNDDRAEWNATYDREHRAEWETRYAAARDAEWNSRSGRDDGDRDGRRGRWGSDRAGFDGPMLRDRFAGDVRIGQRMNSRMRPLTSELREEYRDTDEVYYRYDDKRVYRIDRRTNLVQAMLDLVD